MNPKLAFWGAIVVLASWSIRRLGHGSLRAGVRSLRNDWARHANPPSDPFWEHMATACPWLVLLTIPLGWAYARSTYGVLGGDGYSWITQAARMDVWDATTLVTPFHNFGWAAILSNAARLPGSLLTVSRVASVGFATLASLVAVEITRSLASTRALFFATLSIVPGLASYAANGGTDLPATTMQLVAIYFFLRPRPLCQWLAGVAIGIGFLFRHQSLLVLVAISAVSIFDARGRRRHWPLLVLGTLFGAAPQLLANTLVTNNPLWSEHTKNLAFALSGGADVRDWTRFPDAATPTLASFVPSIPQLVARAVRNLGHDEETPSSFALLALVACIRDGRAARLQAAAIAFVYAFLVAPFWLEPRFLLFTSTTLSFLEGYAFVAVAWVVERGVLRFLPYQRARSFLAFAPLVAAAAGGALGPLVHAPTDEKRALCDRASRCLGSYTDATASTVLSLSSVRVDVASHDLWTPFRTAESRGAQGLAAAVDDPRTTFVLLSRESLRYDEETMAWLEAALRARFEPICMPDLDPASPQLAAFRRRARSEPRPLPVRANDDLTTSSPVPAADLPNETQP